VVPGIAQVPAEQSRHVVHMLAFVMVLNVPLAHVPQPRSLVAEGAPFTNWPARHVR
jgi:hypothetical protein